MAADRPAIEVVIPAFNAAGFLRETLESIAAQTVPPRRVSVVDDRSTDGTPQLVEAAARELAPRLAIRLLRNAGPRGPSAARNTAIRASDADWIALCDADDLMLPDHLVTLAGLAAEPGTVLAFGDCCLFDSTTGATVVASHHAKSRLLELPAEATATGGRRLLGSSFEALLRGPRIPTSACLLRREAVLAAGLFDEAMMFAEDADLFLRLAWLGGLVFTGRRIARKRVHAANLSRADNRVHFARGGAVVALKLRAIARAADPAPFRPAGRDRAACEEATRGALWNYLYDGSRAGFGHYAAAARMAWGAGFPDLALSPRHLARALAHGAGRLTGARRAES